MTRPAAVVTGTGLAVPGLDNADDLLEPRAGGGFDPATGLTGLHLRHKDRASRLALRAVESALGAAGLLADAAYTGTAHSTAVVVSTNLGNLDSVCQFADTIAEHTAIELSPLGLPHTSSNATAGWVAIRYGMRGPNITVCNGPTSGADALSWARNLLAVRRVETVVVVGVEPATEPAVRLLEDGSGRPILDGAAAVVLESAEHALARGARPLAVLAECVQAVDLPTAVALARKADGRPVGLWLTDDDAAQGLAAGAVDVGTPAMDVTTRLGHCSGALGVLQCAAGAAYLTRAGTGSVLATSGGGRDVAAAFVLTGFGGPR